MLTSITFISDFGRSGGYVAACEALLLRVAPAARVLHIDHDIPPGNVASGSRVLARVAPLGPVAVHLAVVDPGVGTKRRPVALDTQRGDFLVGPDNGLLIPAAEALGGIVAAWELDAERVAQQAELPGNRPLSRTFHGRDLFAPAAGLLSRDLPGPLVGDPIPLEDLIRRDPARFEQEDGRLVAEVIEVDRFGNVALAVTLDRLRSTLGGAAYVEVRPAGGLGHPHPARIAHTFADLAPDELGLLEDSWGMAALVKNSASAVEELSLSLGELVTLQALDLGPNRYAPEDQGSGDTGPGDHSR